MKIFFAIFVIFLIGPATAPDGPAAEDEKWEKCNQRIDASLEGTSNYFKLRIKDGLQVEKISLPCSKCKLKEFGTMRRIGDATYEKFSSTVNVNDMEIGTDHFALDCKCKLKTKSGVSVKGETRVVWKDFKISMAMFIDSETKNARISNFDVTSSIDLDSVEFHCSGAKSYVTSCETAGNERRFDEAIKSALRWLFPKKIPGDASNSSIWFGFNCGL